MLQPGQPYLGDGILVIASRFQRLSLSCMKEICTPGENPHYGGMVVPLESQQDKRSGQHLTAHCSCEPPSEVHGPVTGLHSQSNRCDNEHGSTLCPMACPCRQALAGQAQPRERGHGQDGLVHDAAVPRWKMGADDVE